MRSAPRRSKPKLCLSQNILQNGLQAFSDQNHVDFVERIQQRNWSIVGRFISITFLVYWYNPGKRSLGATLLSHQKFNSLRNQDLLSLFIHLNSSMTILSSPGFYLDSNFKH